MSFEFVWADDISTDVITKLFDKRDFYLTLHRYRNKLTGYDRWCDFLKLRFITWLIDDYSVYDFPITEYIDCYNNSNERCFYIFEQ
jgi:hypothetical protein